MIIRDSKYQEVVKMVKNIESQQDAMNTLRGKASELSNSLGLGDGHSQNWASAVAFLKGWLKGFEKGDLL